MNSRSDVIWILIIAFLTLGLFVSRIQDRHRSIHNKTKSLAQISIEDSVEVLIRQRAQEEYSSTIFAGLRFGDSPSTVEKAMKDMKLRIIPYPSEFETVREVVISDYDASYYKGQLMELVLYADSGYSIPLGLTTVYSNKYGIIKHGFNEDVWRFSNCEISIRIEQRVFAYEKKELVSKETVDRLNRKKDTVALSEIEEKILKRSSDLNVVRYYYDSFRRKKNTGTTTDPNFLKITYKSLSLLDLQKREFSNNIRSGFNNKTQEEREREKEEAQHLATEINVNI